MKDRPVEWVSLGGWFVILSGLFAAVTGWAVYDELVTRRPWKALRAEFNQRVKPEARVPISIEQFMVPQLGSVDRCPTCHMAIDRPGYEGAPQPFSTHPQLDVLLGAHPPSRFGCTSCHGGQGLQTKGVGRQAFAHGLDDPFWEQPLLEGSLVQSSCAGCHNARPIEAAPVFELGRRLFEDLRCDACHTTRLRTDRLPGGPPLAWIRSKMSPTFLEAWIRSPHKIRGATRMPNHWPGSPDSLEIRAISAFLYSLEVPPLPELPTGGDPNQGRALYVGLGCDACHRPHQEGQRPWGPSLERVGEKASRAWLGAWLRDPKALWPKARMPNYELSQAEILDLVAYLTSLRDGKEPEVLPRWVGNQTEIEAGRRYIERHGCYGCHEIQGFDEAAEAGPELEGYGDKTPDLLAWGEVEPPRPAAYLQVWTVRKIAEPRAFTSRTNTKLVMPKSQLTELEVEALTAFVLADRRRAPESYQAKPSEREKALEEGEGILRRRGCRQCHEIGRDEDRILDEDGEFLYVEYRPHGGFVRQFYSRPNEAPPSLTFAGEKFRFDWLYRYLMNPTRIRPWLPGRMPQFGLAPEEATTLVRYFALRDDEPYPFRQSAILELEGGDLEEAINLFTNMQCLKCHQLGRDRHPATGSRPPVSGRDASLADPSELAPDLEISGERLTPGWVRAFIFEPQRVLPGTRMPTFFPLADDDEPESYMTPYPELLGGDVHRQVDALVALTLRFGREPDLARRIRRAARRRTQ